MLGAKVLSVLLIVSSFLECFAMVGPNDQPLVRQKRTLLLKKKILGAGAIGLGLGIGIGALKGYKYGYNQAPTTLVERPVYIEKPYYVDRPSIHYPNYGNDYTRTNGWANTAGQSVSSTADLSSYYSGSHYISGYYYR